jgi:hypothetical protein
MSPPFGERRQLERELAGLLLELGDLRDRLEASPAGLLGHFRRRRLARQLAGLEDRMGELRARWAALPDGD